MRKKVTPKPEISSSTEIQYSTDVNIVAAGTVFTGKIESEKNLVISGKYDGEIFCKSEVRILEGAHVKSKLTANSLIIAGKFNGNITAQSTVEIKNTADVEGDIKTDRLIVGEGALFKGNVLMD